MSVTTYNPYTLNPLRTYPYTTEIETDTAIESAHTAHLAWRNQTVQHRSQALLAIADILAQQKQSLAELATEEMGKTLASANSEIEKCIWVCQYYASHAESFLTQENIQTEATESYVQYEPLGVILAVMPWNFPFWQVFRFAAPALVAGNTCILKHASNVSGCALAIERVISDARLPADVFRSLILPASAIPRVIEHPHIKAVTMTGSTQAGRTIGKVAGNAIKKSVLELGGSDPYIILADADISLAAKKCTASRLINNGQSCIGAKRFIVVESVREAFEKALLHEMQQVKMGDPFEPETILGPMAKASLREELHEQVTRSVAAGATCLLGGTIPEMPGNFYPPTILTHVRQGMAAYHEELFGPVASIISVKNESEAVVVANDSEFGLGAAVFSSDISAARKIAQRLDVGSCAINDLVKSDPRLPFGGVKGSGYGRELSHYGLKEFVNIKTVVING